MKPLLLMYARYCARADQSVTSLLNNLKDEELFCSRGSYYQSLFGLYAHLLGGVLYFSSLCRASLIPGLEFPEVIWSEPKEPGRREDFTRAADALTRADAAVIDFVSQVQDFTIPVSLTWYEDRKTVPLHFMLNQLIMHSTHHRGQISQILDELNVEHDFSGIDIDFLPE